MSNFRKLRQAKMNSALMMIPIIVSHGGIVNPIVGLIFIGVVISFICSFMKND